MTHPLSALAAWHFACVRQAALGLLMVVLLALPAARAALEASMWRHMVLQAPLWMLAGALLAGGLGLRARARVARWNAHGISGLLCGTVPELAEALDKTTAAMGHAAQSRVNENFLWQNSAELALTLLPKKGKANG